MLGRYPLNRILATQRSALTPMIEQCQGATPSFPPALPIALVATFGSLESVLKVRVRSL